MAPADEKTWHCFIIGDEERAEKQPQEGPRPTSGLEEWCWQNRKRKQALSAYRGRSQSARCQLLFQGPRSSGIDATGRAEDSSGVGAETLPLPDLCSQAGSYPNFLIQEKTRSFFFWRNLNRKALGLQIQQKVGGKGRELYHVYNVIGRNFMYWPP